MCSTVFGQVTDGSTKATLSVDTPVHARTLVVRKMEDVAVTAVRGTSKSPFTKNTAGFSPIYMGQDIPMLLNFAPSTISNSDAGNGVGYTGIRIRGTDATRINMTINGVPYNDPESQGIFFVNLPDLMSSVQTVEVQRGVGSSSNGSGAFGATMSFSTASENAMDKTTVEFNNSFGSFNTLKNSLKFSTSSKSKFFFDGRISQIKSDGYIDRAETKLNSGFISFAYLNTKTNVRFNAILGKEKTYQAWYGIDANTLKTNRTYNPAGTEKMGAPYDNETDNYKQNHYHFIVNHKLNKDWKIAATSFYTRGLGYYEQYKNQAAYSSYGLPNMMQGSTVLSKTDLIRQLWLDNHFYGQILSASFKKNIHELTLNGTVSNYDGKHFGQIKWAQYGAPVGYTWYNLKSTKADKSAFAKWQVEVDRNVYFYSDVQLRNVHYTTEGFRNNPTLAVNKKYNFVNPKFGLYFGSSSRKNTFAISFAKGSKEPNREDFEANTAQVPKPEILHDWEFNYTYRFKNLSIDFTGYFMDYTDQLILTGKINDVGAYTRQNVSESYRTGAELVGNYKLNKHFTLLANLSISQNKIKSFTEYMDDYDNGGQLEIMHRKKDIAFSPNFISSACLQYNYLSKLNIRLLGKYTGKQYLDNTQNTARSLAGFFTQDFDVQYSPNISKLKRLTLLGQVNNIFNKKYEPNGYTFSYFYGGVTSTENYFFPMAGTNFMIGLNIAL